MEASACSHQLRLLRTRLVTGERRGRSIVYALYDNHVAELLEQALSPRRAPTSRPRVTPPPPKRSRLPPSARHLYSSARPRRRSGSGWRGRPRESRPSGRGSSGRSSRRPGIRRAHPTRATGMRVCTRSRFASSTTRASMYLLGCAPAACPTTVARVRREQPSWWAYSVTLRVRAKSASTAARNAVARGCGSGGLRGARARDPGRA